jgi:hypothetical protein
MRRERPRFQLGVELHADEPGWSSYSMISGEVLSRTLLLLFQWFVWRDIEQNIRRQYEKLHIFCVCYILSPVAYFSTP